MDKCVVNKIKEMIHQRREEDKEIRQIDINYFWDSECHDIGCTFLLYDIREEKFYKEYISFLNNKRENIQELKEYFSQLKKDVYLKETKEICSKVYEQIIIDTEINSNLNIRIRLNECD